jgi:hypothetical protein
MNSAMRGIVAFIAAVASYYFVFWVGGALLLALHVPVFIPMIGAAIVAVMVGRYVWARSVVTGGAMRSATLGAFIVGGIGFCAGFFGPLVFTPGANQGPLLGIFITGPLGFVLGAVGGVIYWRCHGGRTTESRTWS